jgi:hypothetical protein
MSTEPLSLSEKASVFYSQLSSVAGELNSVSDELGKSIAQIDAALKKLNLGVTVWVRVQYGEADERGDHEFWEEMLGYAKLNGKWGVCLKRLEGNLRDPDMAQEEEWLFSDAPRVLRLLSIDKIPELLEKLITQAQLATTKIQAKLADAQAVAIALNPPLFPTRPITAGFKVKGVQR